MDSPLGAVWPTAVSRSGALSGPSGTAARRRVPWSERSWCERGVDGPLSVSCRAAVPHQAGGRERPAGGVAARAAAGPADSSTGLSCSC